MIEINPNIMKMAMTTQGSTNPFPKIRGAVFVSQSTAAIAIPMYLNFFIFNPPI
jgi:hypothetical protein